jgi:hypothetical protein
MDKRLGAKAFAVDRAPCQTFLKSICAEALGVVISISFLRF